MPNAATKKTRLLRFSSALGIQRCCEVDDLSCQGMLEKLRQTSRVRWSDESHGRLGSRDHLEFEPCSVLVELVCKRRL